jgi:hypothetical protein
LRSRRVDAPFGFEHSGLNRLRGSGNRRAIGDSGQPILRCNKTTGREKKKKQEMSCAHSHRLDRIVMLADRSEIKRLKPTLLLPRRPSQPIGSRAGVNQFFYHPV